MQALTNQRKDRIMAKADLTAARLRELLNYNPETGVFTWNISPRSRTSVGDVAGGVEQGYVLIGVDGHSYRAHRLAWLHVHGVWPPNLIDHKNGIKTDNRIDNLREADKSLNGQNMRKAPAHSKSGLLGTAFHSFSGLWLSRIQLRGKQYGLGYYKTAEDAHQAYLTAKRRLHEGCTI